MPGEELLARAREYAPGALIVLSRPSGENHDNSSGEGEFCLTEEERMPSVQGISDVVKMQKAGNTWITPGSMDDTYNSRIVEAVKKGELEEDRLRENIYHFMKALLRLGQHC